ncbi:hypothetical protein BCR44DRAFT_1439375 [Catenaria anguillulae PL171]|uniref:Phospholipid-transporting ATPase n=1 Tax=Catenaria anguillulae PL171 TaxID=765915 RepID=A0A1Y2HG23_9FUNG|nr:hypothetical protein BCR44DRAFT_1439375 [Catenaria anguillulae PL171]
MNKPTSSEPPQADSHPLSDGATSDTLASASTTPPTLATVTTTHSTTAAAATTATTTTSRSNSKWTSRFTSPRFSHQSFLRRFAPIPEGLRLPMKGRRNSEKDPIHAMVDDDEEDVDEQGNPVRRGSRSHGGSASAKAPSHRAAPPPPAPHRRVYINAWPRPHSADAKMVFPSNEIRTTKYTLLSFFPRNLAEQFRRVANSYFLLMVVLQFIPILEVADPSFAALPIVFIVAATAMKDGLEDFRRRIQDKRLNEELAVTLTNWSNVNRPRFTWRDRLRATLPRLPRLRRVSSLFNTPSTTAAHKTHPTADDEDDILATPAPALGPLPPPPAQAPVWQTCKWKDVHVGDMVLLRNNDSIPADVVILATSEMDNMCYVETKSLDGETNLKIRRGPTEMAWVRTPEDVAKVQGVVQCDAPNPALYKFQGTLVVRRVVGGESERAEGQMDRVAPVPAVQQGDAIARPERIAADVNGAELPPSADTLIDMVAPSTPTTNNSDPHRMPLPPSTDKPDPAEHEMVGDDSGEEEEAQFLRIPLTMNSVLLRGCVVRNSEWVIGLVLYTGPESKIQLNAGITPSKRTRIEKQMNPQVVLNFLILFAMCLVCGITHILYFAAFNFENAPFALEPYNRDVTGGLYVGIITFLTCVIIFQNLVPISLYVTVEIVKSAQAYFIHCDETMYDEDLDRPCSVRTWNLSDDLGQIEYIFSDKTGTLTRNIMELRKCSIAGVVYGDAFAKADEATQVEMLTDFQTRVRALDKSETRTVSTKPTTFVDSDVLPHLTHERSKERSFFLLLALCHTVLPEKVTDADKNETTITYKAQSPDEEALVTAAQSLGITFLNRSQSNMVVSVLGEIKVYDVLEILEFTSARKRMSVVVRDPDLGICVLTKGADSVIFERMAAGQHELRKTTLDQLQWFANDGLRTLCIAYRRVDESVFAQWHKRYQEASLLAVGREEAMDLVADDLEQQLVLMGATAIEDKLQDQVPETIEKLISAGIKVWVLTGDKVETAITVGFSCNLLERDMTMIVIQGDDYKSTRRQLQQSLATLLEDDDVPPPATAADGLSREEDVNEDEPLVRGGTVFGAGTTTSSPVDAKGHLTPPQSGSLPRPGSQLSSSSAAGGVGANASSSESTTSRSRGRTRYALVIDGSSLKYALEKENRLLFLEVGCRCISVICCRVSPLQKAQVVALVRKELDCLSLSIGDGANDVSMIQEANVGIGIAGLEGYQAVMASDYAIAQFKYLQQLLLIHGRWSYRRIAVMNLTFFYKNIIWTFVLFWYQFYCGFSAGINYEYSYVNYYNLFFTVLPTMILGTFDQDVPANRALAFPKLYESGLKQSLYNSSKFWMYILDALYQSLVCYFVGYFLYTDGVMSYHAWGSAGHYEVGTAMAMYAITTANVYIALNLKSWSWIMAVGVPLNLVLFPLYVWVYSIYSADSPIAGLEFALLRSPSFWFSVPLATFLCVIPRVCLEYWRVNYYPADVELVRKIPMGEVAGDVPSATAHSGIGHWLHRLWHHPSVHGESAEHLQDEEVELRPRPAGGAAGLGSLALENIMGSLHQAVDTVRVFGRTQRERFSRRLAPSALSAHRDRPSFLMYMGGPSGGPRPRRQPNTGFAFSADEAGLPPLIRRRPRDELTSDTMSDSHVELTRSRSRAAKGPRRQGHARMFSM